MQLINDFLRSQTDKGVYYYGLMGTIGQGIMLLMVVFYLIWTWVKISPAVSDKITTKDKIFTTIKGVVMAAIAYYFSLSAHRFMLWYQVGFDPNLYNSTVANLAVGFTLLPLLAWLCAKVFNTTTGFAGDVTALTILGFHVAGRSGCLFTGCCYGFACDWGWYSHAAVADAVHETINNTTIVDESIVLPSAESVAYRFPVSLVESLLTLGILIFLLVRICRKGYTPDGKNLPYFLLIYGIGRFITETTRDSAKADWIIWRFSDIHIHMLLMAVVGAFLLYSIARKSRVVTSPEEPQLPKVTAKWH